MPIASNNTIATSYQTELVALRAAASAPYFTVGSKAYIDKGELVNKRKGQTYGFVIRDRGEVENQLAVSAGAKKNVVERKVELSIEPWHIFEQNNVVEGKTDLQFDKEVAEMDGPALVQGAVKKEIAKDMAKCTTAFVGNAGEFEPLSMAAGHLSSITSEPLYGFCDPMVESLVTSRGAQFVPTGAPEMYKQGHLGIFHGADYRSQRFLKVVKVPAAMATAMASATFTSFNATTNVLTIKIAAAGSAFKVSQGCPFWVDGIVATDTLGNRNLLLVDEAHAGIAGNKSEKADDRAWQRRRAAICEKGFAFEYSATFAQAVKGTDHEDAYAKSILFDYSYRWFYADGYGKDYRIFNIPGTGTLPDIRFRYLTGMLLSHYQQLRLWEEGGAFRESFRLAKPLWVFVGSTVSAGKKSGALAGDDRVAATDVAEIIRFIAHFLEKPDEARGAISDLLWKTGAETGLLSGDGTDLFAGAFTALKSMAPGGTAAVAAAVHSDILRRVFHGQAGRLVLERIPGDNGEIVLRAQGSEAEEPFGLVNVGSPKELCDHLASLPDLADKVDFAPESAFAKPQFDSLRDSSSPMDLLIGSKKFVEGWDCWRVGTLGLMHVGKSEGAQIIQLFGRGVRLKGWDGRLKRSSRSGAPSVPPNLQVLETLGVFGIEADFMQKFRDYLKDEGLPGNERPNRVTMPLAVTYDFGRRLKILRPKKNGPDGREYDFKRDGRVPRVDGNVPDGLVRNPVVADWYPRIQSIESKARNLAATAKNAGRLPMDLLALLDWDKAYFALEDFKRDRSWHNLDLSPEGLKAALERAVAPGTKGRPWYTLYLPDRWLEGPPSTDSLRTAQAIAEELLKRYAERLYNESKAAFYEPRLELRDVTDADLMLPPVDETGARLYSFSIEGATEDEAADMAADIKGRGRRHGCGHQEAPRGVEDEAGPARRNREHQGHPIPEASFRAALLAPAEGEDIHPARLPERQRISVRQRPLRVGEGACGGTRRPRSVSPPQCEHEQGRRLLRGRELPSGLPVMDRGWSEATVGVRRAARPRPRGSRQSEGPVLQDRQGNRTPSGRPGCRTGQLYRHSDADK